MLETMKWMRRIFWSVFLFSFGAIFSSDCYIISHLDDTFTGHAECAVVFGAAVWRDDIPSQALYDRTMSGIQLYKKHHVDCLIFSGGASKMGAHEVDVMKKMALEEGVPEAHLRLDYKGKDTKSTIRNLPQDVESFVMVSNDFHLARIEFLVKKMNFKNVFLHAATYYAGVYQRRPYYFFREIFGIILYFLFSFFLI